ncbi:MAG: hypothetical protein HRU70_06305 [Phycisphaeraceae bacterium]|nr:MAG: hypothetical protein HRU70_06305 [Phycisphaeraceae bacterium]
MLRLPIGHAAPGLVLARPVLHPKRRGTVLLREGVTLDDLAIRRLTELNVPLLWVVCPGLEHLARYSSPEIDEACVALASQIDHACDHDPKHPRLDFPAYRDAVTTLIHRLVTHPTAAHFLGDLGSSPRLRHAANACLLSILIGLKLDFYLVRERPRLSSAKAKELSSLGVGAMLRDFGHGLIAPAALERWARTADQNDPAWREHTTLGFDALKDTLDPSAASVLLHHHQRFDGTGFPPHTNLDGSSTTPSGHDIHIFARIVAAADLFDRLRYPPSGLVEGVPARPNVVALSEIIRPPYRAWLDPIVMLALLHAAPAFPPGSMVTLSDGREAAVVEWNALDPCRPTVRPLDILRSPPAPTGEAIDLSRTPTLTITHAEGVPVSGYLFTPDQPHTFDLATAARRMSDRSHLLLDPPPTSPPPTPGGRHR